MSAFHLKDEIAMPLQAQARELRKLATTPDQIQAYNCICDHLDQIQAKLANSAGGALQKDWEKIV